MYSDKFNDDNDTNDELENDFLENDHVDDDHEKELNINEDKNVVFRIKIEITSDKFNQIALFVKFPQSTRNQQVTFVSSNFSQLEKTYEKFSAVYKYLINPNTHLAIR